jgi:hypothetical protein
MKKTTYRRGAGGRPLAHAQNSTVIVPEKVRPICGVTSFFAGIPALLARSAAGFGLQSACRLKNACALPYGGNLIGVNYIINMVSFAPSCEERWRLYRL